MHKKLKIYTPTGLQYAVLPILSIVLLASTHFRLLQEYVFSGTVEEAAADYVSGIGQYFDSSLSRNIGVMVFWLFVGTAAYAVLGALALLVHPLTTMAHLSQQLHYRSAKTQANVKRALLVRFTLRTIAISALVAWLAANITFFARAIDDVFIHAVTNGPLFLVVVAIMLCSVDLFIPVVLTRLLVLRTRVFHVVI